MAQRVVCLRSPFVSLLVPVLVAIFISACAGPPQALMTASVTKGQAPLSVSFANQSKNADEVRWDFGDGATATTTKEKKTIHEYTKAGAHAVTITAVKKGEPPQTSTATISITVEPGPLERVKIEPPVPTLEVTGELKFTPTALDRFANPIPGLNYTFRSDEKAGKVDPEGKLTAGASAGSYESGITVEVAQGSATRAASAKVTVKPGPLHRVNIDPVEATVEVTKERKFTATAVDRFGNPIPDLSYTFGSDKGPGQVTSDGGLTAGTKAGVYPNGVTVDATQGLATRTASAAVTLRPGPLDSVKLEPTAATGEVGKEQKFTATAFDRYDNPIPGLTYSFRSQEGAGKVEQNGEYTAGLKAGSYPQGITVEASQGSVTRTATAGLTLRHGPLDRVLLTPTTAILDIDKTAQFKAEAVDQYRNPIPDAKITWQLAGQIGTLDDTGLLRTGTKAGRFGQAVKAIASLGRDSKEGTASVTINPGPPVGLAIPPIELAAGEAQQLKAFVADRYGNPVSEVGKATITVRDGNAGAISPTDLFTAGQVGGSFKDAIEARSAEGGLSATTSVTIRPGSLEQVVIGPNPAEIGMELPQQFVAVGADQFGNRLSGLTFTWSLEAGGGTIDARGLFTAGSKPGVYNNTIRATATQGNVTRSATASVTVEPDRIAFISTGKDQQLDVYVMNVDGTNLKRLTNAPTLKFGVSWSPDGRRLVRDAIRIDETGAAIVVMNDDGTFPVVLVEGYYLFPAWSPDGKDVVVTHVTGENQSHIAIMEADGSARTDLTKVTGQFNGVASWSPDGKRLVFISDRDGNQEVYVMNRDGSNQTRLTFTPADESWPRWSPDGSGILFDSNLDGDQEIYLMKADGGGVRQLTFNSVEDEMPSWSPDGSRILYVSQTGPENYDVYVMTRNGSSAARLTDNPSVELSPTWAPRKRGVEVSEASVFIPNSSALKGGTVQEVAARVRSAVVRIKTDEGGGSGFIIDPNGLILTANHVITDAKTITVFLEDGTSYTARIHGRDLIRDLAVLKIEASNLPTLELGDVSRVSIGSEVLVAGYPLGLAGFTVTKGVASSLKYDAGTNTWLVQTDSTINPGNSGGPLLNSRGQVIGVISFEISGAEGFGLAVSANTVATYLERLKAGQVIAN